MVSRPRVYVMPKLGWGYRNPSPFCEKVLLYLELAGVECDVEQVLSPKGGPKGKYPWIDVGGRQIADSQGIVDWVVAEHGDPLGELAVPEAQRRRNHLVRRVVEESLYFALVTERWSSPQVWPALRPAFLPLLPPVVGGALLSVVRRNMLSQMHAQGYGRHNLDDLAAMVGDDLDGIVEILGDAQFFGGDAPVGTDVVVFAWVSNNLDVPVRTRLGAAVRARPALVEHYDRMKSRLDAHLDAKAS